MAGEGGGKGNGTEYVFKLSYVPVFPEIRDINDKHVPRCPLFQLRKTLYELQMGQFSFICTVQSHFSAENGTYGAVKLQIVLI